MTTIAIALGIACIGCLLVPDRVFARSGPAGIAFGVLSLLAWLVSHRH